MALAVGAGARVIEAAKLANYAAGIAVGKIGTATVSQEELIKAIRKY
jgi:D-beta-D-heptose 7-phosphate kinase/D-beta-D-heptose 1-phosphate adenosyltransferase